MSFYAPSVRFGLHPYMPERLGFRALLGLVNPRLAALLEVTDEYTLVSGRNRTTLFREAESVLRRGVVGDFLEVGVHRGGSAAILAHLLKSEAERCLHLFDRWGDLPEPTERDGHRQQEYRKDRIGEKLSDLQENPPLLATEDLIHRKIDYPADRVLYYQGWYSDTFKTYSGNEIAFVSIDCDYYESVRDTLAFVEKYLSPGATMVVDDYLSWPGAKAAVDEWLSKTDLHVKRYVLSTGPVVLRLL